MTNTAARFRDLVDAALALHAKSPEYHPQLNAALASARDHVARALAEVSATLSTSPAPALEPVAVKDLKVGDRVLLAAPITAIEKGTARISVEDDFCWVGDGDEVLRDPREVRS